MLTLDFHNLEIVYILTIGFTVAGILGYLSQYFNLSPILGYLLAGFLIGPFSPGYVANLEVSEQLAEIGVILMMFGVGLHFKWQDLVNVKSIAIPGALGQIFVATTVTAILIHLIGWPWDAGIIIGLAISVASTVVLVRVLSDQNLLTTTQGHITIGWLIVEDIITVLVLILLPTIIALFGGGDISIKDVLISLAMVGFKFLLLAIIMCTLGYKIVTYVMLKIARTRSQELFTLAVLALTFLIATGIAVVFGASIALGAFIAGMVVGQTVVRHQAFANATPLKDAFVVIFFLSVGMLFNPSAIIEHFPLFISVLGVILLIKPLAALIIVLMLRYPLKTALTVSIALAQIGEFSFILAEEAIKLGVFPDEGYDIIVACALISISINPIFFKLINFLTETVEKINPTTLTNQNDLENNYTQAPSKAVVVGFGPIGQSIRPNLIKMGFMPIVIDRNVDTISKLIEENRDAVYGDAALPHMLEITQIKEAKLLIITAPEIEIALSIIRTARQLNPSITILTRAKYMGDLELLKDSKVNFICCDEEEVIKAFNKALMELKNSKLTLIT